MHLMVMAAECTCAYSSSRKVFCKPLVLILSFFGGFNITPQFHRAAVILLGLQTFRGQPSYVSTFVEVSTSQPYHFWSDGLSMSKPLITLCHCDKNAPKTRRPLDS